MVQVNRLSGDRQYAAYLIVGKAKVDEENTGQEMNNESSGEKRYWKRIAYGNKMYLNRTAFQTMNYFRTLNAFIILLWQTSQQFFQIYIQRKVPTFSLCQ